MFCKKAFIFMFTLLWALFIPIMAAAQPAPQPKTAAGSSKGSLASGAEAALLMDYASGKVLFEKDAQKRLPMASVTKLMTMLLIVQAEAQGKIKMTDKVPTSEHAYDMGGSQIYLEPGEEMSAMDMLIAIATGSANDASMAMAEYVAGSEEAFVEAMNQKARDLGLKNTHFVNPTGLPADNHYTTAYDLAMILREDLKYPLFCKVSSIYEYDLRGGDFKLWNTNKLLKWYKGADAGKTGWTNQAKYCLAASAVRDNLRLVSVVLGCSQPKSHFSETIKLFNYGFAKYKAVNLAQAGAKVGMVKVGKGTQDQLDVITAGPVGVVVNKGEEKTVSGKINLPATLDAPVKKGQTVGSYVVYKNGQQIQKVDLIARNEVDKASPMKLFGDILNRVYNLEN